MTGLYPVEAMPRNVPSQLHQQPQAPQPRPSMPKSNIVPAGSLYVPINPQPYHHPPLPPTDLRQHAAPEIQNPRGASPQKYRAFRLEKASSGSSWEKTTISEKPMSQSSIRDRIEWLQKNTSSVTKKKQEKHETIRYQLDKVQSDLTRGDRDVRFYYKLAQLESEWRAADDRSDRTSRKHRGHSKRHKFPKLERVAIVAYFVSTPATDRDGSRPHGTNVPVKQSKQTQQTHNTQRSAEGLPPIIHASSFIRPVSSDARGTAPIMFDSRLKGQTKPTIVQQPTAPQAQPPDQGVFNIPKQDGRVPAKHDAAMLRNLSSGGPAQGQASVGQPQRLPSVQLPFRPPQIPGPRPMSKTLPTLSPAGSVAPRGAAEAGGQPSAPRSIITESKPNAKHRIKVYHDSDQSSLSSDDGWSEDESEGTTPSSISSDHSQQRGRGRSPKCTHPDYHRDVITQDSRNARNEAKYAHDGRVKPPQRQRVRFDSPDYVYREESHSPRVKYYSQPRVEESWRAEPPRIVQAPRHSVRHVPGPTPRRDSSNEKYIIEERPLERARLNDAHHIYDVRRDNDHFKHLEEDVQRHRDFRERRDDRRENSNKYAGSDSRWSDQKARDYMRHREPHHSHRHHQWHVTQRGYDE
ncbi:hypothetical protein FLONG3_7107 [Fusarium longipes]|uniref:Uncharacterized protein n=1 Tax=Fusarium longipes TaxID=694270 RepID=A0A395SGH7_9HYPO|nr:hypothetical protein FLONG3_7107 [Fusarium longipes]